jgi:hypothetical protein
MEDRIASNFRAEESANEKPAWSFQMIAQSAASCSRWFLTRSFSNPEDGGETILRNVGSHKNYTVPQPRKRLYSTTTKQTSYAATMRLEDAV